MTAAPSRSRPGNGSPDAEAPNRNEGRWLLLDARQRLLAIGSSLFHGQSPRSYVDPISRRLLLPAAAEVADSGEALDMVRHDNDRALWITVRPVIGRSGAVHALLAAYVDADRELPPAPKIGTWEWDAPRLRTYWDRDLFDIYGFDPQDDTRQYWESPEWFGLLDQGGYPQMREVLARFQSASDEHLIIHMFRVARARDGELTTLRLAGRAVLEDGTPRWFRGITMPVDGFQFEVDELFREQQFLDAALQLCPNPMAVIDLMDLRIYLTNATWKKSDILAPADMHLETITHPDDFERFVDFMRAAPAVPSQTMAETRARFAVEGGWRECAVSAVRVANSHESTLHEDVMLLLRS